MDARKQQIWQEVKKRHRMSEEVVKMAQKMGMNPKKIGGLDNHKQEPWKLPLAEFIKELHEKRFGSKTLGSLDIE